MKQFIYHYRTASGIIEAENMEQARIKAAHLMGVKVDSKRLSVSEA